MEVPPQDSAVVSQCINRNATANMKDVNNELCWVDVKNGTQFSVVGLVQILSNKATMALKSTAFVVYTVFVILLNCFVAYRRSINENGPSLIGFSPIHFDTKEEGDAQSQFKN